MKQWIKGALFAALAFLATPLWAEVNLNTASAEVLDQELSGVGPAKAALIVRFRDENGPFQTVDDLRLVKGIGPATVDRNRDRIILN